MHVYEVGKPYSGTRSNWTEAIEYNYRAGQHVLRLFLNNLSAADVEGIGNGPLRLGLVVDPPVLILVYQFGEVIPWSDAPYTWHMVPAAEQQPLPDEIPDGTGALLSIILVESTTGIIKAIRGISLATVFSRRLHQAIREQAAAPFDQAAYDRKLAALYRNHSSKQLFSRAIAQTEVARGSDQAN